jgi:hypothetical protein
VVPADDDVAAGDGVAVIAEIAAFELEFDVDALPAVGSDLAFCFAVWEAGLDGFDDIAQLFGDHAEEKDYALFVDGFVAEATEVHGLAVAGAAVQGWMAKFGGCRRREILRAKPALRMTALCFFASDMDEVIVPRDRSGLCRGEKSYDIGPFGGPFGFALRKGAKDIRKAGPGAETAFKGAMVEFPEVTVGAARRRFAILANCGGPILEEFAVFEAFVQGVRLESGSFNGVIPGGEELRDLMFVDSGEGV